MNLRTVRDFHVNSSLSAQMHLYSTTVPNNRFLLSSDAFTAQVINSFRSLRKKRMFVNGKTKSRKENSERIEVVNCRRKFGILCLLALPGNSKIKYNVAILMRNISMSFNWQKDCRKWKLKMYVYKTETIIPCLP